MKMKSLVSPWFAKGYSNYCSHDRSLSQKRALKNGSSFVGFVRKLRGLTIGIRTSHLGNTTCLVSF